MSLVKFRSRYFSLDDILSSQERVPCLFNTNVSFLGVGELTKKYANLPESYIKRMMDQAEWKTPRGFPQYLRREIVRKNKYFGLNRPWTGAFQMENARGRYHPKVFVEPIKDWTIFKGDRVEILVGDDKGKQGIVSRLIQERNWVFVEGLNCKLKVMGKTKTFPGTVFRAEQPLLVTTEVALVDPSDLQSTKIEWRYNEEGEKVRVSARTGRIIPVPQQADETYDYKSKATYRESTKDTNEKELTKITFSPKIKTFEMDIMDSMGIKEERIPCKTYWY
ncbi:hypothetical protein AAG570_002994 [Ranatra chinensis]|uniref:Large ribosomal subunit protein uL24m n=1 Tax=Ranatra chinensis TaxID=642074 RepID=A0ABD0YHW4_9HEMI